MPVTKQYLRFEHSATFGVVSGRKANVLLLSTTRESKRRQLIVAPVAEDVILWDPRRGDKTAVLRGEKKQEVCCVCLSRAGGDLLAAGCEDGTLRLWNVTSTESVASYSGHKSAVTCVVFDSSGTRLVSGSKDTTVVVWDVVGGCGLYRLKGHKGPVTACQWIHHGNTLITASKDNLIKLWDIDTQHCYQTLVGHKSEVWGIEVVAMETRLVTVSSDCELQVFKISLIEGQGEGGGGMGDESVGSKRRNERTDRGDMKVPVSCDLIGRIGCHSNSRPLQLKSDSSGRLLGSLSSGMLELYLVRTAEERDKAIRKKRKKIHRKRTEEDKPHAEVTLTASEEIPYLMSITARAKMRSFDIQSWTGNKMIVALGLHSNSVELHTLDMLTTPPCHTHTSTISSPGHRTDVRALCFSSDDSFIASGSTTLIKVWNRSNLQCLHTMQSGNVLCMTFVPGDRHILAGTKAGNLQLFDIGSGDLLHDTQAHSGAVWSLDISPDRNGVVTGSADHDVKFWNFELVSDPDTTTRRQLSICHTKTLKMSEDVLCVCYSPDNRLLSVALLDTTVKIFFNDTLKFFLSLYGHKLPVLAMDISSDSTLLVTCSADKNIRIWGLDFGDCHKSLFAHDDSVMGIKFVPETHIVFTCGKDRFVKCWDVDTFDHIMTLEGHCGEVWCMSVSHDGNTVVTGSHDHSLRLWEKTDEPLILSEEREKERDTLFEDAMAEGGEIVVPGEVSEGDVSMAGQKTVESMRAAEQLMEALAIYKEEKVKGQEWVEECRIEQIEVPCPKPHPLLVAMGNITAEKYVLQTVKKIKSSELHEALLVMPFSEVIEFLPLLDIWIQNGWSVELSCRCLFFLLRIHHHQIVTNHILLPVIDSLRQTTRPTIETIRDMYGFNLAGLQSIQYGMKTAGTPVFADVSEKLHRIQKKKKLKRVI